MNDIYETKAAVIAAKETMQKFNTELPIIASTVYDEGQKTLTGSSPEICCAILESLGVSAIGINCSLGPAQMKPAVLRLLESTSLPVLVKPNAGLPSSQDGKTVYDVTKEEFAKTVAEFCKQGAAIVGGCCGTNPSYIKQLVENVEKISREINLIHGRKKSVIASGTKLVEFGNVPVLIGERINPTGKKN